MDQFLTPSRTIHCKIKNESYIKEEIMIPDVTEYFDDVSSVVDNTLLQVDVILYGKLNKHESKLNHKEEICNEENINFDEEIDIINVDEHSEKLFVETHKKISESQEQTNIETNNFDNNVIRVYQCNINVDVDVTSCEESLMLDVSDQSSDGRENNFLDGMNTSKSPRETTVLQVYTNDKDKENIMPDKKNYETPQKQITKFNLSVMPLRGSNKLSSVTNNAPKSVVDKDALKTTSKAISKTASKKAITNKKDKFKTVLLVCLKCSRKEKVLNTSSSPNCRDCKEPMSYECLTCCDQMDSIEDIYNHIKNKCDQQKIYRCKQCNYQGKNKKNLRRHLLRQHSVDSKCSNCGKVFKIKASLIRHEKGCGVYVLFLKCKLCPFNTKYKYNLSNHMRNIHKHLKPKQLASIIKKITEEGEKIKANALNSTVHPNVYVLPKTVDYNKFIQLYCSKCDKVYKTANYKKDQDCQKCGTTTLLQCIKCKRRCPKVKTMNIHLQIKCATQNFYYCADCDYKTANKWCLKAHIIRKHIVLPFKDYERCSKCDQRFKYRVDRVNHERRCSQNSALQCKLCPFKSRSLSYFNLHMQDHTPHLTTSVNVLKSTNLIEELKVENMTKPFCSKCAKSITYVKYTKKPCKKCGTKLTYPCNKCGKVYSRIDSLQVHMSRHHLGSLVKKCHQCLKCGKRFSLYENLQSHQKSCCNKQPDLQCTHCSFKSKYRWNVARHTQKKHGVKNIKDTFATDDSSE